jgi:hypothetical protein
MFKLATHRSSGLCAAYVAPDPTISSRQWVSASPCRPVPGTVGRGGGVLPRHRALHLVGPHATGLCKDPSEYDLSGAAACLRTPVHPSLRNLICLRQRSPTVLTRRTDLPHSLPKSRNRGSDSSSHTDPASTAESSVGQHVLASTLRQ